MKRSSIAFAPRLSTGRNSLDTPSPSYGYSRGRPEQKRGASHPWYRTVETAAQASGRPSLPERWELPDMPVENGQRRWFPDEPVRGWLQVSTSKSKRFGTLDDPWRRAVS